jgi:hypothetical protein
VCFCVCDEIDPDEGVAEEIVMSTRHEEELASLGRLHDAGVCVYVCVCVCVCVCDEMMKSTQMRMLLRRWL